MNTADDYRFDTQAVKLLQACKNGLACHVLRESKRIAAQRGLRDGVYRITADDVRDALPIAVKHLLHEECEAESGEAT